MHDKFNAFVTLAAVHSRYGLIRDAPLFGWLEENMDKLMARDTVATAYAIERSCINKAEVGCVLMWVVC